MRETFNTSLIAVLWVIFMAKQEKARRKVLLDVKDANLRSYGGITVQTIPKEWLRRMDLRPFFRSDLEIVLVLVGGEVHIEIRRKQWALKEASDDSDEKCRRKTVRSVILDNHVL
jgi:hypothetical protein